MNPNTSTVLKPRRGRPPKVDRQFDDTRQALIRSGLEVLGTLPFEASQAISCIPDYQHENVNAWLDRAQTFVSQLGDLWRNHHA